MLKWQKLTTCKTQKRFYGCGWSKNPIDNKLDAFERAARSGLQSWTPIVNHRHHTHIGQLSFSQPSFANFEQHNPNSFVAQPQIMSRNGKHKYGIGWAIIFHSFQSWFSTSLVRFSVRFSVTYCNVWQVAQQKSDCMYDVLIDRDMTRQKQTLRYR